MSITIVMEGTVQLLPNQFKIEYWKKTLHTVNIIPRQKYARDYVIEINADEVVYVKWNVLQNIHVLFS